MPDKPVYVLDTNVIVSAALLPRSLTRKAFDKALRVYDEAKGKWTKEKKQILKLIGPLPCLKWDRLYLRSKRGK